MKILCYVSIFEIFLNIQGLLLYQQAEKITILLFCSDEKVTFILYPVLLLFLLSSSL